MCALLKHLILEYMAFGTNVLNTIHTGGRRAMIPMTSGARWRAEISPNNQRVMVHAGAVLRELVRGN